MHSLLTAGAGARTAVLRRTHELAETSWPVISLSFPTVSLVGSVTNEWNVASATLAAAQRRCVVQTAGGYARPQHR